MKRPALLLSLGLLTLAAAGPKPPPAGAVAAEKRTYVYKVAGECALKADVFRLPDETVRPVILWIHGGALMMGSRGDIHPAQREYYVTRGFAVVAIDYRLAPETKLPGIIEDVHDAYRWLRREGSEAFNIDPDRVAVVGHSAGGYLTLLAGHHLEPRPAALVSFYGYGDITGEWYSRPDPFYNRQSAIAREDAYRAVGRTPIAENPPRGRARYYRYCRQQGIWPQEVTGHDPDTDPHVFEPWCPLRNVTADYPPTLLLHGDRDTDVPVEQSVLMAAELAKHGVEHAFIRRADWVHGFDGMKPVLRNPEIARTFDQVAAFLEQHLNAP